MKTCLVACSFDMTCAAKSCAAKFQSEHRWHTRLSSKQTGIGPHLGTEGNQCWMVCWEIHMRTCWLQSSWHSILSAKPVPKSTQISQPLLLIIICDIKCSFVMWSVRMIPIWASPFACAPSRGNITCGQSQLHVDGWCPKLVAVFEQWFRRFGSNSRSSRSPVIILYTKHTTF